MKELNMFNASRWCIGNTFKLKQLLEKRMTKKIETHLVFLDLKKYVYHSK